MIEEANQDLDIFVQFLVGEGVEVLDLQSNQLIIIVSVLEMS